MAVAKIENIVPRPRRVVQSLRRYQTTASASSPHGVCDDRSVRAIIAALRARSRV